MDDKENDPSIPIEDRIKVKMEKLSDLAIAELRQRGMSEAEIEKLLKSGRGKIQRKSDA